MKKYLFISAALALAGCTSEDYLGVENAPNSKENGAIEFASNMGKVTRGDVMGAAAAELLGGNFIVEGTKGTEATDAPTSNVVFDNYLVAFGANTAGTTESNTHNWEYVGKENGTTLVSADTWTALHAGATDAKSQTIKYWDYSVPRYDFIAYSTGKMKAVTSDPSNASEVKVTRIATGTTLSSVAYSFTGTSVDALKECYITDIIPVLKADYGKVVTLKFKNLTSKVRVGLYETIPGYSVKDVQFYNDNLNVKLTKEASPLHNDLFTQEVWGSDKDAARTKIEKYTAWDGDTHGVETYKFYAAETGGEALEKSTIHAELITANDYFDYRGSSISQYSVYDSNKNYYTAETHVDPVNTATLFTDDAIIPASGTITVKYPYIGSLNVSNDAYDKAQIAVTSGDAKVSELTFGELTANYGGKHGHEATGNVYLGITLPEATMAGSSNANFYTSVMPNGNGPSLNLRVNYTLVSTDGSGETIKVWGAKAVVPSTYTNWQPNYAYTYIFKISDNTNGSTAALGDIEGLFPITFDAVVTEMTDVNGEQTTITTVATPSITTYQQGHDYSAQNEYSKASGKKLYVQVMNNAVTPATLVTTLAAENSQLLKLSVDDATEAAVMDAFINNTEGIGNSSIIGRNGLTLVKNNGNIDNTVTSIENGVDDNPVTVVAGTTAAIDIADLATGTYAYVYTQTASTKMINKYQPIAVETGNSVADGYVDIAVTTAVAATTATAAANKLYFTKTTNGTGTATYSYVTTKEGDDVTGLYEIDMPATPTKTSSTTAEAGHMYFDVYKQNNGKYAVKVIKVVA